MNCKNDRSISLARQRFSSIVLISLLLVSLVPRALAEEHYIVAGHPDGIALLAPPPAPGTEEAAADLATVEAAFKARTEAETKRAEKDAALSFELFKPAIGPTFELDKLPKVAALMKKVKAEIGDTINVPKDYYKRTRPYLVDTNLNLGKPEPSFSYPSGHSTRGTVYSMVLAEIYPDKTDALMTMGQTIGWDRVLIGKHYPTDIQAGRVLGKAIVRELNANAAFQHDLAAAKAEAEAAQH